MFENLSFTSLTNTVTQAANCLWDSTKSFLTTEPEPLWQKAMREPGYQAYLRFKSDLEHRPEEALRNIVSPYVVITNQELHSQTYEAITQLLQSNTETALTYFYNDIINHLVELSANDVNNGLLRTNTTIDTFKQMLEFYQPYVPEDIYQAVLKQTKLINQTNIQSSLVNLTKKINQAFKHLQLDLNSNDDTEQHFSQNPEPYHSVNYKNLILMGAVSLLANRNSFALGLATTVILAEPINAALPTVVNPIPTQYIQPGQNFSYDIDLNQVFNDADGDIMTFGGVTMADGSPLPSWVRAEPVFLGSYDTPGNAWGVTVLNGVAYVADYGRGLQFIDISNLAAPILLGNYNTPGIAFDVTVQNGVAYVADGSSGLQLINVSNLAAPILLGNYNTPGVAYDVTVQNGVAYVADGMSGLQLINVNNPAAPSLLGNYNTPGAVYDVTVQNDVAYVADGSSLQLINVSNPAAPSLLGNYPLSAAVSVTFLNNVAYLTDDLPSSPSLQLINISNLAAPSLVGSYATAGNAYEVTVQNGVAYVAEQNFGLQFINISNPAMPRLLGNYDTPGSAYDVTVLNGVAFVADYDFGLQILDLRQTRLLGTLPANATGIYNFSVHATSINGEWIATSMQLRVGTAPTTAASAISSSTSTYTSASTSLPIQSSQPITTPSVSMSDTGTDTGTSSTISTSSTPLAMPSSSPMTATMPQSASPTATSTSTTPTVPMSTTNTAPNPSTGNSGDVSGASRLTSSLLLSSALLLSTTGLGFLAKNRKTERSQEEPVEVVENTIVLRH